MSVGAVEQLRGLTKDNCHPSEESIAQLATGDVVLISGQFVGAGKSKFIAELERQGRRNIASHTNRDLRPGEVEGVDKCHSTLEAMAVEAEAGRYLELEEVRPNVFYATPADFTPGDSYVKDLELKGALRLRGFVPTLPIIVPVPPLTQAEHGGVTDWEARLARRESYHKQLSDDGIVDLRARLENVVEEVDRIQQLDLVGDPDTLFVVNGDLGSALRTMNKFLATGRQPDRGAMDAHLAALANFTLDALLET